MIHDEKIAVPEISYKLENNCYRCPNGNAWVTLYCRDKVQEVYAPLILKGTKAGNLQFLRENVKFAFKMFPKVVDVLSRVESQLQLNSKSKFSTTTISGLFFINPADFWITDTLRFSFFTNLIREINTFCNTKYNEDDWQKYVLAANHSEYFSSTRKTVDKFLSGSTFIYWLTYSGLLGWHNCFVGDVNERILLDPRKFSHDYYTKLVEKQAEQLWADAGKPRGRDKDFWFTAENMCAMRSLR